MSEIVTLDVVIVGMAELIEAVSSAGLSHESARQMQTSDGSLQPVDLVVTDESGTRVGVQVDRETGQAAFVAPQHGDRRVTALVNRIAQRYAYSQALAELKRKGYQIAREERQVDGTIKIVAQRWR